MSANPEAHKIFSITPNPALDLGGVVNSVVPDEKNYVHDETRYPGGNAINAARIIHRLGHPVELSGFLGGGIGTEIQEMMEAEGLRTRFIPIAGSTRINITISNANRHQTRLSYPGPQITLEERGALQRYIKGIARGSLVIFGGSFPPGIDSDFLNHMVSLLAENECESIVDVPGPLLKGLDRSPTHPLLIKPNLTEFQQLVGKDVTSRQDVIIAARELCRKIPLVCVSSVEGGALLVTPYGTWFGRTPTIEVKSTVGAGDSMVGSMCGQLLNWEFKTRRDPAFAAQAKQQGGSLLQWGLAAACATLSVHGTQLGQAAEIRGFVDKIAIEQL